MGADAGLQIFLVISSKHRYYMRDPRSKPQDAEFAALALKYLKRVPKALRHRFSTLASKDLKRAVLKIF